MNQRAVATTKRKKRMEPHETTIASLKKHAYWKHAGITPELTSILENPQKTVSRRTNVDRADAFHDARVHRNDIEPLQIPNLDAITIVRVDGRFSKALTDLARCADAGIRVTAAQACPPSKCSSSTSQRQQAARNGGNSSQLLFRDRCMNSATEALSISINDNHKNVHAIHLIDVTTTACAPFTHALSELSIGENVHATIIHSVHRPPGTTRTRAKKRVMNITTEVHLGQNAHVHLAVVETNIPSLELLHSMTVTLADHALLQQTTLACTTSTIHHLHHITLAGMDARAHTTSIASPFQHGQIGTDIAIDHVGEHGTSSTMCNTLLRDDARSVFVGNVHVAPSGKNTKAHLKNDNLLLSNTATAITEPTLEIETDNVQCSHGATTGALDDQFFFFAQSRGISHEEASQLFIEARTDECLANIDLPDVRAFAKNAITSHLPTTPSTDIPTHQPPLNANT